MIILIVIAVLVGISVGIAYYVKHPKQKRESFILVWFVSFLVVTFGFLAMTITSFVETLNYPQQPATSTEIQKATDQYRIVDSRLYDQKNHKMSTYPYDVTFADVDSPIVEIKIVTSISFVDNINPFKQDKSREIVVKRVVLPRNIDTSTLTHVKVQDTVKVKSDSSVSPS